MLSGVKPGAKQFAGPLRDFRGTTQIVVYAFDETIGNAVLS